MIKISIITPSMNSGKTIEKTIQSVIGQKYTNIEYIIVDGGSSDDTMKIVKSYQDHVIHFISEPDDGISDAFNKGLKVVTGDVVGIINSDDILSSQILHKIASAFEKKGVDYIYGNLILKNKSGDVIRTVKPAVTDRFSYSGMPYGHPTLFVRKHVYDEIGGFNVNYKISMDFELYTRMHGKYNGYYLAEDIAEYTRDGVSDIHYIRGYQEIFSASIASEKASFIVAAYYFVRNITRTIARKIVERGTHFVR